MGRKLFQIKRAGSKDWKYVFKYKANCYRESLWDPFGALAVLFPSFANDPAKVCKTANTQPRADGGTACTLSTGARWKLGLRSSWVQKQDGIDAAWKGRLA